MFYLGLENYLLKALTNIKVEIKNSWHDKGNNSIEGIHKNEIKKHQYHGQIVLGYFFKKWIKFELSTGLFRLFETLEIKNLAVTGQENIQPHHTYSIGAAARGDFQFSFWRHTILGFTALFPLSISAEAFPCSWQTFLKMFHPFVGIHSTINYLQPIYSSNLDKVGFNTNSPSFIRPSFGPCAGFDFQINSRLTFRFQYRYEYICSSVIALATASIKDLQNVDHTVEQKTIFYPHCHYLGFGIFYSFISKQ